MQNIHFLDFFRSANALTTKTNHFPPEDDGTVTMTTAPDADDDDDDKYQEITWCGHRGG